SKSSIFYTPRYGNLLSIFDGTDFVNFPISELLLSLTGSHSANNIYDIWAALNSGIPMLGTGPAWQNSAAGLCSRGAGANTTEVGLFNGIYTNSNSIQLLNGATNWTVPVNQARLLGSVWIDSVAGQTTAHFGYGQSRKFGLSNADNRGSIRLRAGDNT